MNDKTKLLPVKSDFIFKLIFGDQRNTDILTGFLKSVLDIPEEEYDYLTVIDPHLKKESLTDKYAILDVKVHTKSGGIIQVEIQVAPIPDMIPRVIYGQSKMVTEQMASGDNWGIIKRVISIIITDFTLVPGNGKYHNQFRYRSMDGTEFTKLMEIDTLELEKIPLETDGTELWPWVKFIKSDSEEALDVIAEKNPQIKKAVGVLKELSADERTRMLYEEREKTRRDLQSRIDGARNEQSILIAKNAINMNMNTDIIIKLTGLTREVIESLQTESAV